jgi:ssRNA-specific RNase YbeY (16S rRNA maturation enzyme)
MASPSHCLTKMHSTYVLTEYVLHLKGFSHQFSNNEKTRRDKQIITFFDLPAEPVNSDLNCFWGVSVYLVL